MGFGTLDVEQACRRSNPATPSKEAVIEAALPRGGSLTGSTDAMELAVDRLTGAQLVRVNRSTDELEPWLAESWTAAPGNLIYTVKLRPGLTSADGTALTAADARDIAGVDHREGTARGVRAIDPLTLEIRFTSPFAPGLRVLDQHPIAGFGPFVGEGRTLHAQPALLAQGGRMVRRFLIWMRLW